MRYVVRRTWPIRYRLFPSSKCIFFCFLSNKREERDYLLSLFVLLYVELVSFGTPRQEHTWNRFIRKNGTRVIFYFWYFLSYWMISSIPRIPRTQMKSLHFWFLVVTYFHIRLMERIEKCNYTNSHFYLLFSSMNTHEIMKIPLIGKYQVPRIPRTHMKSLHFWFFVITFDTLYYYFFFNKIDGFYW